MLDIVFIVGTRPEAVKVAPIYRVCLENERIDPRLISTGQHREMLDQVFATFGITADEDLAIMQEGRSLSQIIAAALSGLDEIFAKKRPDVIVAQGDTATVLAAALAAFNREIPFAHIEAGLRTRDLSHPFPEEGYRQMAQRIARWNFAPTQMAIEALEAECLVGVNHRVGNTVIDALLDVAAQDAPSDFTSTKDRYVLITGHRRENQGDGFRRAFEGLRRLAVAFPETDFVYPVHLNPVVLDMANEMLTGLGNFHLIKPQPYAAFVTLMKRACLILTDSGGIQEEAPSFGVPVLVMRDKTERQEGVEAGVSALVGTDPDRIFDAAATLLSDDAALHAMQAAENPFGDGHAAERIVDILLRDLVDA